MRNSYRSPRAFTVIDTRQTQAQIRGSPLETGSPGLWRHLFIGPLDDRALERTAKRALDVIVASALLALTLPVILATALAVRLSSTGPILFRQERIGEGGRPFTLYKFRTMLDKSDSEIHRAYVHSLIKGEARAFTGTFKLLHDARITPVGRVLRRFSLDELPQLLNVLEGTMSLVGPRPALTYEVEIYGELERGRLMVSPGITGLWQVSGRATTDFHQMIALDLAYIQGWSLGLDLEILRRTPAAVLSGRGAC